MPCVYCEAETNILIKFTLILVSKTLDIKLSIRCSDYGCGQRIAESFLFFLTNKLALSLLSLEQEVC